MTRAFDIGASLFGIVVLTPLFIIICVLIKLDSKGAIFYKQIRVGKDSVDFDLLKFRTMRVNADKSGLLTVGEKDARITKIGYFLRKYKIDELPQLYNVLVGDMSLVGPRPEVRKYVELYDVEQAAVLKVRPGITDWASIRYKDENNLLAKALDPEKTYIEVIMPEKIKLNMIYINNQTIAHYLKIVFSTLKGI